MGSQTVQLIRALIEQAMPLCSSDNLLVQTSGNRIVAILVDALMEIDLTMVNPWDELPAVSSAPAASPSTGK